MRRNERKEGKQEEEKRVKAGKGRRCGGRRKKEVGEGRTGG